MEVLRFKLSGRTAFFKKPEVNSYVYFTYSNIHRIATLGVLGAIIGYGGYGKVYCKNDKILFKGEMKTPNFYEKLEKIRIAIEPLNQRGYNEKKIQAFNNSVGYASKEAGGNFITKEQWLENPCWNIYCIINNSEECKKIKDYLMNNKCVFYPYLGKNDHMADISEVSILEVDEKTDSNVFKMDSLFLSSLTEYEEYDEEDDDDETELIYKYEEYLPISLNEETSLYEFEKFVFTNKRIEKYNGEFYEVDGKNIAFF